MKKPLDSDAVQAMDSKSPWNGWLILLGVWVLNAALFVPGMFFTENPNRPFPFLPQPGDLAPLGGSRESIQEWAEWIFRERNNADFFRVSFDFVVMLALMGLTSRTRLRGIIRVACLTYYVWLLAFLTYHQWFEYFFYRQPALWEDVQAALSGLHYILQVGTKQDWILGALGLVLVGACIAGIGKVFEHIQLWGQPRKPLWLAGASVLVVAACGAHRWFHDETDDPVVQINSKRLVKNIRASLERAEATNRVRNSPPDRSYDAFAALTLPRKPNVYLLMVESYGEVAASCESSAPAYRDLMARIQARLDKAGYHSRTAYSRAPVHGSMSHLALATVQTGIRIDHPSLYQLLGGLHAPNVTSFFKAHGYQTIALQPGNKDRVGLKRFDMYERDQLYQAAEVPYQGPGYGWGRIPDQFSLSWARENVLPSAKAPYFFFFMGVSTHWNWWPPIPYVADWKTLQRSDVKDDTTHWPPLDRADQIDNILLSRHVQTLNYEWRVLADFIENEPREDAVFLIIGDHQPLITCEKTAHRKTFHTAFHVVARDPVWVDLFANLGFVPGLYASPTQSTSLTHEGFYSLLVTKLIEYGHQPAPPSLYKSEGIPLSGLYR